MDSKNTISISEARKRIFKLADEIQKPGVYYTFTEKGRPKAVLLSVEYFDSIMETINVMQEFPNLERDVKEVERSYRSGEYKEWTTLEELLAREGFVVADKSIKKYGISAKNQAKRRKRIK